MIKNKKGLFLNEAGTIILVGFLTMFFAIITIYFAANSSDANREGTIKKMTTINQDNLLINYLSARVGKIGNVDNVADLVALALEDEEYVTHLELITNRLITPSFNKNKWVLEIGYKQDRFEPLIGFNTEDKGWLVNILSTSEQIIPSINGENIIVRLSILKD